MTQCAIKISGIVVFCCFGEGDSSDTHQNFKRISLSFENILGGMPLIYAPRIYQSCLFCRAELDMMWFDRSYVAHILTNCYRST